MKRAVVFSLIVFLVFVAGLLAGRYLFPVMITKTVLSGSPERSATMTSVHDSKSTSSTTPSVSGKNPMPAGGLQQILNGAGSQYQKNRQLYLYAETLSASEISGMMKELESLPLMDHYSVGSILMGRWVELDSEGALAYVIKNQDQALSRSLISSVFSSLASRNIDEALASVRKLDTQEKRNGALQAVLDILADKDPGRALTIAKSEIKGFDLGVAFLILSRWIEKDPRGAVGYIDQMPDSVQKSDMIHSAAFNWAQKDPTAAAVSVRKSSLAEEEKKQILGSK